NGLTGHHGAHDERDRDGDPEIHRNAGVLQVVANAIPPELIRGSRTQTGLCLDSLTDFFCTDAGLWAHQQVGKLRALAPDEINRLTVARVNDRIAQEGSRGIRDANDSDLVVVHLQLALQLQRFVWEE